MEMELIRTTLTPQSTIGELKINNVFECFMLEDCDRGLTKDMPISEIISKKIKGNTCIPSGKYEIVVSYSNKFKKKLPLLDPVPGFSGIRIHTGNTPADTTGCLLPGKNKATNQVSESKVAFENLFEKILKAMESEKVFMTIKCQPAKPIATIAISLAIKKGNNKKG